MVITVHIGTQIAGDPGTQIYNVNMEDDKGGCWNETLGSEELLKVFLKGLKAAFSFTNTKYSITEEYKTDEPL